MNEPRPPRSEEAHCTFSPAEHEQAGEPCDRLYAREAAERIRLGGSTCRCGLWYLGEVNVADEPPASPIRTTRPSTPPAQHNRAA